MSATEHEVKVRPGTLYSLRTCSPRLRHPPSPTRRQPSATLQPPLLAHQSSHHKSTAAPDFLPRPSASFRLLVSSAFFSTPPFAAPPVHTRASKRNQTIVDSSPQSLTKRRYHVRAHSRIHPNQRRPAHPSPDQETSPLASFGTSKSTSSAFQKCRQGNRAPLWSKVQEARTPA